MAVRTLHFRDKQQLSHWSRNVLGRLRFAVDHARFKKRMGAAPLEEALWGGFATTSLAILEVQANDGGDTALHHAWARTRHARAVGDEEAALQWLDRTVELGDWRREPVDLALYRAGVLEALGRGGEALELVRRLHRRYGNDTTILFALASAASCAGEPADNVLKWINRAYRRAGLDGLSVDPGCAHATLATLATPLRRSDRTPLVSVIMPMHNAEATVDYAVRAILAQTEARLELIVVDDASTDGSVEAAFAAARGDARVRIIQQEQNQGAYAARNRGLAEARGRYITVNDADDWSHQSRLALQCEHLERGAPFCTTSGISVLRDLRIAPHPRNARAIRENLSSLMLRTDELRALGGWDEVRFGADSELYERLRARHGCSRRMVKRGVPLAFLLRGAGSLTANSATGAWSSRYGARREYKEAYRRWHRSETTLVMGTTRPFPAPAIALQRDPPTHQFDLLLVGDLRDDLTTLTISEPSSQIGVLHVPAPRAINAPAHPTVRGKLHAGKWQSLVPGERARCDRVLILSANVYRTPPDLLPVIEAGAIVLCDGAADPPKARIARLFGVDVADVAVVADE